MDITLSTCKDCIANGAAIPDCWHVHREGDSANCCQQGEGDDKRWQQQTTTVEAAQAVAADDGRHIFFLKPQWCASLNKYSGGNGREEAPRGQIVGRVER